MTASNLGPVHRASEAYRRDLLPCRLPPLQTLLREHHPAAVRVHAQGALPCRADALGPGICVDGALLLVLQRQGVAHRQGAPSLALQAQCRNDQQGQELLK